MKTLLPGRKRRHGGLDDGFCLLENLIFIVEILVLLCACAEVLVDYQKKSETIVEKIQILEGKNEELQ